MRRPQFTLRALLVLVLAAGCFFGGMAAQRQLDKPAVTRVRPCGLGSVVLETLTTPDGKIWTRLVLDEDGADIFIPEENESPAASATDD